MTPNQREVLQRAHDKGGELPVPDVSHKLRRTVQSLERKGLLRLGVAAAWGVVYELTDDGRVEVAKLTEEATR